MRFKGMAESARGHNFSLSFIFSETVSSAATHGEKKLTFFFPMAEKNKSKVTLQKAYFFLAQEKKKVRS